MIITIDGPAGAGKSTAAKLVARRLGFEFLDTGAMYRAVTVAALRAGIDLQDQGALAKLVESLRIELPGDRVLLNGEDVSVEIRAPQITAASASIAGSPAVRQRLVEWQRRIAAGRDMVCEGRDQGTVVFPQAECKFFLSADPKERARRRLRELKARGDNTTFQEVLEAQEARDARDAARDIAPMVPAADAIVLDTTDLTLDDVVARMVQEVWRRQGKSGEQASHS
ncbi:MAG: (d)CMP kinase [Gemmataceae bacterium]|nr:(d)CMP kinase [Gemmataceae bacterium]